MLFDIETFIPIGGEISVWTAWVETKKLWCLKHFPSHAQRVHRVHMGELEGVYLAIPIHPQCNLMDLRQNYAYLFIFKFFIIHHTWRCAIFSSYVWCIALLGLWWDSAIFILEKLSHTQIGTYATGCRFMLFRINGFRYIHFPGHGKLSKFRTTSRLPVVIWFQTS